jgi:hypothetical protein
MAGDELNQDDIERLLAQSSGSHVEQLSGQGTNSASSPDALDQGEIEALLRSAEAMSGTAPAAGNPASASKAVAGKETRAPLSQGDVKKTLNQVSESPLGKDKPSSDPLVGEGEILRSSRFDQWQAGRGNASRRVGVSAGGVFRSTSL